MTGTNWWHGRVSCTLQVWTFGGQVTLSASFPEQVQGVVGAFLDDLGLQQRIDDTTFVPRDHSTGGQQ